MIPKTKAFKRYEQIRAYRKLLGTEYSILGEEYKILNMQILEDGRVLFKVRGLYDNARAFTVSEDKMHKILKRVIEVKRKQNDRQTYSIGDSPITPDKKDKKVYWYGIQGSDR